MSELARSKVELDRFLEPIRAEGRPIGFVPTMGALHAGHRSLVDASVERGDVTVVSIFVNRHQFGEADDFAAYPRRLDADLSMLDAARASAVFLPEERELFPDGEARPSAEPGELAEPLEGAYRPGHFAAVAAVVERLLRACRPERAYFGEKDYQQLLVVRRLVAALALPVEIVACPTVRADDGLALSSRNDRLGVAERAAAPVLYRALCAGVALLEAGEADLTRVESVMAATVAAEPLARLDYAVAVDAADLGRPTRPIRPLRLLVAARFGPVRLIDNLGVELPPPHGEVQGTF